MRAMILAAGRGTRLKELTENCPKPLVKVGETSPLMRTLELLSKQGISDVVINLHYLGEKIEQALANKPFGLNIHFSKEEELLETAGGIANALPLLGDEPFLCINGDVVWTEDKEPVLQQLMQAYDADKMDAMLVMFPKEKADTFFGAGDFFVADNAVATMRGNKAEAPYVYTGIQVLHPRCFKEQKIEHAPLKGIYQSLCEKQRLHGLVYNGYWVDMGTPEGLKKAEEVI